MSHVSTPWESKSDGRRWRLLALALVVLLVLVGAGIGTLVSEDSPDDSDVPVVTVTPTATTSDGGGDPSAGTATPTETGPSTDVGTPSATETPTDDSPDGTDTPDEDDRNDDDRNDEDRAGSGGGSGGSGGGGPTPTVTLEAVGPTALLDYDDVAPEDSGRDEVRVQNAGTREARLSVADVNVTDHENGIVGSEEPVDSTPEDGELSDHVMLVVEAHFPDGTTDYLFGTSPGSPRSLAAVGGESDQAETDLLGPDQEATIAFDWHVPASTGNEVQSDGAEVDVTFQLLAD